MRTPGRAPDDAHEVHANGLSHPWEWDIKRLAASFMVAARHMRLSRLTSESLIESLVTQYRT
jgi:uncharacterized protein (DUF2252 family)